VVPPKPATMIVEIMVSLKEHEELKVVHRKEAAKLAMKIKQQIVVI
jgi:hypothetical protein